MTAEHPAPELGFVIIAHGRLGHELLVVARHILGEQLGDVPLVQVPFAGAETMREFAGSPHPYRDRQERAGRELAAALAAVGQGAGVIVLTDIYGGSSFQIAREVLAAGSGAIISGMNLPMLLKIPSVRHLPFAEAVSGLVERSRGAIVAGSGTKGYLGKAP